MTYAVVKLRAWQYRWLLESQEAAEGGRPELTGEHFAALEASDCWTMVCDGDPIACGGVMEHWRGRYVAWIYMGKNASEHIVAITRIARDKVSRAKGRVEMTCRADFAQGLRWARMLGFVVETPLLKAYGPQGEDHVGFVRIN